MYLSDVIGKEDRVEVTFSDFRKLVDGCSRLDVLERYLRGREEWNLKKDVIMAILGIEEEAEAEKEEK